MSEAINGKLLKTLNDSVVRLETQHSSVTRTLQEIKDILLAADKKCDRTCEANQNRFGQLFTHIKFQWFVIGTITAGFFTLAFFVLRKAIT